MLLALVSVIIFKGGDAISVYSHIVLLLATFVAVGLSAISRTLRKDSLLNGLRRSAAQILPAVPLLLLIALITTTWLLSGVVPTLIAMASNSQPHGFSCHNMRRLRSRVGPDRQFVNDNRHHRRSLHRHCRSYLVEAYRLHHTKSVKNKRKQFNGGKIHYRAKMLLHNRDDFINFVAVPVSCRNFHGKSGQTFL